MARTSTLALFLVFAACGRAASPPDSGIRDADVPDEDPRGDRTSPGDPPPDATAEPRPDVAPRCEPHTPGSPWCRNVRVTPPKEVPAGEPTLAITDDGKVTVAWMEPPEVKVASSDDGVHFGEPDTVEDAFGDVHLVARGGDLVLGYLHNDGHEGTLMSPRVRVRPGGADAFSDPVKLVTSGFNDRPWLSVDGDGSLWLVWWAVGSLDNPIGPLSLWRSEDGLTWDPRGTIERPAGTSGLGAFTPVAATGGGRVLVAWTSWDRENVASVDLFASTGGGPFERLVIDRLAAPADVDPSRTPRSVAAMVAAGVGQRVYVAYSRPSAGQRCDLMLRVSDDGGKTFAEAARVNDQPGAVAPSLPQYWLTSDGDVGGAHLAWYERAADRWRIQWASTRDGRSFSRGPLGDATFAVETSWTDLEEGNPEWPGHFMDLKSWLGRLFAAWGDNRNGHSAVYFAQTALPVF